MSAMLSESQLHNAVADYLALAIPEDHPDAYWTTIGHGGGGRIRGAQLKRRGVKKGVPDILLCWWDGFSNRVGWIELKAAKGCVSEEQRSFLHRAAGLCQDTALCRSLDEVCNTLRRWDVPVRCRLDGVAA